jgi:hypothetical protein
MPSQRRAARRRNAQFVNVEIESAVKVMSEIFGHDPRQGRCLDRSSTPVSHTSAYARWALP